MYSGIQEPNWVAPFEDLLLSVSIEQHDGAAGGTVVETKANADIVSAVHTPVNPNETTDQQQADEKQFIAPIQQATAEGKQDAVADV